MADVGGVGTVYEVRGNSVDGNLTYTPDGGSATTFAVVKDGLIKSIDSTVPLPAAGSLPTGTNGQILRNVSGVWTAVDVTEVTLRYCASGTPTTGTFLKL